MDRQFSRRQALDLGAKITGGAAALAAAGYVGFRVHGDAGESTPTPLSEPIPSH